MSENFFELFNNKSEVTEEIKSNEPIINAPTEKVCESKDNIVEEDFEDVGVVDEESGVENEYSEVFKMKTKTKVKPKFDSNKKYDMIPKVTQQFRFCGNPFRIDCYKGCDFGCKYCFANASNLLGRKGWQTGDIGRLERFMSRALDKDENGNYLCETNSLSMECVRHKVPFHCGGLSDPFQEREWELGITYRLIQLSNKYNYPISFSSKTAHLPEKYWEILNPKLHAFQTSLFSKEDDYVSRFETNTPSATERIAFVRELHKRGFWTSIRIQPCIDIDKAVDLVKEISGDVNYITVEHLKIDIGNEDIKELFSDQVSSGDYRRISTMLFEMDTNKKIDDVRRIKAVSKCPIGCGDNDIHYLSDSDCCCGVDTMGEEFSNWMKYNMTYMSKHENENFDKLWTPKQSCSECFFKGSFGLKITAKDIHDLDYKQFVKEYCRRHPDFMKYVEYEFNLFGEE